MSVADEGRDRRLLERSRRRMADRLPYRELWLPMPGAAEPYVIALPDDPERLLDQLAIQTQSPPGAPPDPADAAGNARAIIATGDRLPYWALLWPSGHALAEDILRRHTGEPLAGLRALELGCGLGVTAVAAAEGGARLWIADCFAEALLFARYNVLRNTGVAPRTLLLDWRTPAGRAACQCLAPLDLLLAADVLYEQPDVIPLLTLVPTLLRPGGRFWLAEPGRRVSRVFLHEAQAAGWRDTPTSYTRIWPTEEEPVTVTIHHFTLPGG